MYFAFGVLMTIFVATSLNKSAHAQSDDNTPEAYRQRDDLENKLKKQREERNKRISDEKNSIIGKNSNISEADAWAQAESNLKGNADFKKLEDGISGTKNSLSKIKDQISGARKDGKKERGNFDQTLTQNSQKIKDSQQWADCQASQSKSIQCQKYLKNVESAQEVSKMADSVSVKAAEMARTVIMSRSDPNAPNAISQGFDNAQKISKTSAVIQGSNAAAHVTTAVGLGYTSRNVKRNLERLQLLMEEKNKEYTNNISSIKGYRDYIEQLERENIILKQNLPADSYSSEGIAKAFPMKNKIKLNNERIESYKQKIENSEARNKSIESDFATLKKAREEQKGVLVTVNSAAQLESIKASNAVTGLALDLQMANRAKEQKDLMKDTQGGGGTVLCTPGQPGCGDNTNPYTQLTQGPGSSKGLTFSNDPGFGKPTNVGDTGGASDIAGDDNTTDHTRLNSPAANAMGAPGGGNTAGLSPSAGGGGAGSASVGGAGGGDENAEAGEEPLEQKVAGGNYALGGKPSSAATGSKLGGGSSLGSGLGGLGLDKMPDLSKMLGDLMGGKDGEENKSLLESANDPSRSLASSDEEGFLSPEENIFDRIHKTYQFKQSQGWVGKNL